VTDSPERSEGLSPRHLAGVVYPDGEPSLDDPAENYHESSKAYPSFLAREVPGVARLEGDPALQQVVARAVKRHPHLPSVPLPPPMPLDASLGTVLRNRRSAREPRGAPLSLEHLATLLHAAYGVTCEAPQPLRTVPSGGALYPLELYVVANAVRGLAARLYHFDPLRHALEKLGSPRAAGTLEDAFVYPEFAGASAVVAVTALFWRTRFKYGLRGYRFALLEAGHVVQNLLLTATALGLAAIPIGGYYDARLERLLGVDGVNEAALYCAAIDSGPVER
jgi:SagB-type dehydrogenase family enzyme